MVTYNVLKSLAEGWAKGEVSFAFLLNTRVPLSEVQEFSDLWGVPTFVLYEWLAGARVPHILVQKGIIAEILEISKPR